MKTLDDANGYWEWRELYKPIVNHFEKNAAIDGCLYLPVGKQWDFLCQHANENIWTLIVTDMEDNDETLWEITSGIHFVNMQGYLLTEIPYSEEVSVIY